MFGNGYFLSISESVRTTVKNADQIIVIDRGKISQQGTHDELIKQSGIYADFVGMREKAIGWKIKADSLA